MAQPWHLRAEYLDAAALGIADVARPDGSPTEHELGTVTHECRAE